MTPPKLSSIPDPGWLRGFGPERAESLELETGFINGTSRASVSPPCNPGGSRGVLPPIPVGGCSVPTLLLAAPPPPHPGLFSGVSSGSTGTD